MDAGTILHRTVSEPDSLFVASLTKSNEVPCSIASSEASLIHLTSRSPVCSNHLVQRSHSTDQFFIKARGSNLDSIFWHTPHSVKTFSNDSSSPLSPSSSSSSKDSGSHVESEHRQYSRFDESPPGTASSQNHVCLERIMSTSIPRRREFSEQFRDLAQLHENSDVPLAKWDDASRLFPKQFGLPPLVAISIWKQVDGDADMMLTEAEYCLAAHLANKYSTTGFSLLAPSSHPPSPRHSDVAGAFSSSHSSLLSSRYQRCKRRRGRRRQRNGLDAAYLLNAEDDSHDLLLSPDSRLLGQIDGKQSPWSSSSSDRSLSITCKENTSSIDAGEEEEEYEDDDQKGISDDEIGVQALLPSSVSVHRRHTHVTSDVKVKQGRKAKRRINNESSVSSGSSSPPSSSQESSASSSDEVKSSSPGEGEIGDEEGSTSDDDDASVSLTDSPSSSPVPTTRTRMESICSISPSVKVIDPVEILCKFTHRSRDDIASFSAHRRRRLLASFVRAAKSTNYTLLRLNNELVGELQELCDQHTNLNAQVRHLSDIGP